MTTVRVKGGLGLKKKINMQNLNLLQNYLLQN